MRSRRTKRESELFAHGLMAITHEIKPATVRQVFYQAVVRGLIEKTERSYKRVASVLADLRKGGVMPYDWLADGTRWQRKPRSYDSLAAAIEATARFYRRDALARASRYVELWLEKDALAGVVLLATSEFDVPLMSARGFASLSFLHSSAEHIREEQRPTTIYHLGDFDPSGQCAARATRDTLMKLSGRSDLEFRQLAVLPEQILEWRLPTRPTKREGNAHARGWVGDSVELDAIHPDQLRRLVSEALQQHIPLGELRVLRAAEDSEREALTIFSSEIDKYPDDECTFLVERLSGMMARDEI